MTRILKSITILVVSVSMSLSPISFPVTAQAQQPDPQAVAELLQMLSEANSLLQRLKVLEEQRAQDAEAIETLASRVTEQQDALDGVQASIMALSQALASIEALGQQTASLAEEAAAAIPQASEELQDLLTQAHGTIQPGNWVEGLGTPDILARLGNVRQTVESVRDEFERQQQKFDTHLSTACNDSPISEAIASQLAPFISGAVPSLWNPGLAALAASNLIPLPACFSTTTENGRTVEEELQTYVADRQASQQLAAAMNSMMLVAMSTGNPYVMAAVVAIMVLMAIFSREGGGGGERDSSGPGDDEGTSGTTPGTTVIKETPGKANGGGVNGNGEVVEVPPASTGIVPPSTAYPNVAEGMETWVEVNGQAIRFTDSESGEPWEVNWPPAIRGSDKTIPDFTGEVRILAADVKNKIFRVRMRIPFCDGQEEFNIGADPDEPGGLIVADGLSNACLF